MRQRFDLRFRNVPVLEAQQARLGQLFHAGLGLTARVLERIDALRSSRVFALRRDQFRAIHFEQRLAFADGLAGDIDVQTFDVALNLGEMA